MATKWQGFTLPENEQGESLRECLFENIYYRWAAKILYGKDSLLSGLADRETDASPFTVVSLPQCLRGCARRSEGFPASCRNFFAWVFSCLSSSIS